MFLKFRLIESTLIERMNDWKTRLWSSVENRQKKKEEELSRREGMMKKIESEIHVQLNINEMKIFWKFYLEFLKNSVGNLIILWMRKFEFLKYWFYFILNFYSFIVKFGGKWENCGEHMWTSVKST